MRKPLEERLLSYDAVGATSVVDAKHETPPGYRRFEETVLVGTGTDHWTFASHAILRWGIKTRSGFTIQGADGTSVTNTVVSPGDRFWLVAHMGPLRIKEPVRIVAVVDQPRRKGFAYGTLVGHPVSGEEAFILDLDDDGSVWLTIRSLTRPATGLRRATFPALALAQRWYRRRYLCALIEPVAP